MFLFQTETFFILSTYYLSCEGGLQSIVSTPPGPGGLTETDCLVLLSSRTDVRCDWDWCDGSVLYYTDII